MEKHERLEGLLGWEAALALFDMEMFATGGGNAEASRNSAEGAETGVWSMRASHGNGTDGEGCFFEEWCFRSHAHNMPRLS